MAPLVQNEVLQVDQWDKTSLTPTVLEQLFVNSLVTEYIIDGDSRTDGISLCRGIVSSLQSAAHNSGNNDSKSEQLYHPHLEQGQSLELTTKTADDRNNSSCDIMFCLDRDVTDHSFSSYRKSLESFDGYILPEARTYLEKPYTNDKSDASNPSTTLAEESASIKEVTSAETVLSHGQQSSTVAFREVKNSTASPHHSSPGDKCHISALSLESNHSLMKTSDTFNSGSNLYSSNSEPLLSETAETITRPPKVIKPVKKNQEVFTSSAISSDADKYMESSDCGETFDDDDDEYVNCTAVKVQSHD